MWFTAVGLGFAAGLVGQYLGDVINNWQSGKTGLEAFTTGLSSPIEYLESGLAGAIAAIPGLSVAKTLFAGTAAQVARDLGGGDIKDINDLAISARNGLISSSMGVLSSKAMVALKVKQIDNMHRNVQKTYLKDKVTFSSQANININYHTYNTLKFVRKMEVVEGGMVAFRVGIYSTTASTATSTLFTVFE